MTDWKAERVRALVVAAENSIQRTRWIFLVLNLGCVVIISAQLNLYMPWARHVRKRAPKELHNILDRVLWNELYNGSIPLLGIKYSADDLIILGTAAMSVLALWFVYAHRRENHCLGTLRDIAVEAKTNDRALTSYIYAAVAHHFVFTTTTQDDDIYGRRGTKIVPRWHVIVLIHLPWVASLAVVIVKAVSVFVPEIELVAVPDHSRPAFSQFQPFEKFEAVFRMVWGLVFTLLTTYYCFRAQKFDRNTTEMLGEMEKAALDS